MDNNSFQDLPDIELDAEIAQQILNEAEGFSDRTAELARFIARYKEPYRNYLINNGLIENTINIDDSDSFVLAAVDGASRVVPRGGGSMVVGSAYKVSIVNEVQRGTVDVVSIPNSVDADSFATLLRIHLELLLLNRESIDDDVLLVLDHSFWGIMQATGRALASYKNLMSQITEAGRNPQQDAMIMEWMRLFNASLNIDGSFLQMIRNKQVISLSKQGISRFFLLKFNEMLTEDEVPEKDKTFITALNDRVLLKHVLRAGEFTVPQSLYQTVSETDNIRWKRSRFATGFDDTPFDDPFESRQLVFDEYGIPRDDSQEIVGRRIFISYYRPYDWARAYRIEFHERMLVRSRDEPNTMDYSGQGTRFQILLASIKRSLNRENMEPTAQVLADLRAKSAIGGALQAVPEKTFYQLRQTYRGNTELLNIIDSLLDEERT
ncbi:MAG: hypothetical protein CL608_07010 [Anaerolineaceae bacterium]|nr:hypothetical protein [Anaerolineaceae bacterium]